MEMEMDSEQKQVGWSFVVWWTGLTLIGGFVSRYVNDLLFTESGWLVFVVGVYGLAVSSMQWILLRNYFSRSILWLVTGVAGFAFGALISDIVIFALINTWNTIDVIWLTLTGALIVGIVLGTYQWMFLKHFHTKAGWWISGNGIIEILRSLIVIFFSTTIHSNLITPILLDVLRGIITGVLLFWILHQPIPEQSEKSRLDIVRLDIGFWLLLGIAYVRIIFQANSGFIGLYLLGISLASALVGGRLGKLRGAIYGWAIGIVVGFFTWFILTCQFCQ